MNQSSPLLIQKLFLATVIRVWLPVFPDVFMAVKKPSGKITFTY